MTNNMPNDAFLTQAEEVVQSVKFPSQPQIIIDIQQEINQPEPEFKKVAEMLSMDLALTAKVLKVVNSPFYAAKGAINSPQHALAMLGLKNFESIVLSPSMQDPKYNFRMTPEELNLFLKHSRQTAKVAKMIAQVIFPGDSEQHGRACMAGLFHDCGIPILVKRYPDYFEKISPHCQEGAALELAEEKIYQTNHSVAGSLIANTWGIPQFVRQVIFYHHQEDFTFHEDEDLIELLSIVMLAEKIIAEMHGTHELNIYQSIVSEDCFMRIMDKLNLSIEHFSILKENAQKLDAIDQEPPSCEGGSLHNKS